MQLVSSDTEPPGPFTYRLATAADIPALRSLVTSAIDQNMHEFLSPEQVAASHKIMSLDPALIADGTYYVIEAGGVIAGCGGWSRRVALYTIPGEDDSQPPQYVDPAKEPAKIRAMYTHPAFTRRGVGRMLLAISEAAAAESGFTRLELVATMSGQPLYLAYGFEPVEPGVDTSTGVHVPVVRMTKSIRQLAA